MVRTWNTAQREIHRKRIAMKSSPRFFQYPRVSRGKSNAVGPVQSPSQRAPFTLYTDNPTLFASHPQSRKARSTTEQRAQDLAEPLWFTLGFEYLPRLGFSRSMKPGRLFKMNLAPGPSQAL
jgi:hypothetical protein